MGLPIRIETRTGDTSASKRQRQRRDPPDILLTTPEQIALLLASPDAATLFAGLRRIVLDELHALVTSKRGDLLALDLARLRRLAPGVQTVGLSATVREPDELRAYLVPGRAEPAGRARRRAPEGAGGRTSPCSTRASGCPGPGTAPATRSARSTTASGPPEADAALRQHALPGRAAVLGPVAHQRRQPADRAAPRLARRRPAPQGRGRHGGRPAQGGGRHRDARPRHRLGRRRSRHQCRRAQGREPADPADRPRQPPARRAVARPAGAGQPLRGAGMPGRHRRPRPTGAQDTPVPRAGALDVLAQHILGMACAEPFEADALYRRGRRSPRPTPG